MLAFQREFRSWRDGVWYAPVVLIVPVGGGCVGSIHLDVVPLGLVLVALYVCHPHALPLLLGADGVGEEVASPQGPVYVGQHRPVWVEGRELL